MRDSRYDLRLFIREMWPMLVLLVVCIGLMVWIYPYVLAEREAEAAAVAATARAEAHAQFDAWARAAGCLERHTGYDGQPVDVWTCAPVPTWRPQMVEVE